MLLALSSKVPHSAVVPKEPSESRSPVLGRQFMCLIGASHVRLIAGMVDADSDFRNAKAFWWPFPAS